MPLRLAWRLLSYYAECCTQGSCRSALCPETLYRAFHGRLYGIPLALLRCMGRPTFGLLPKWPPAHLGVGVKALVLHVMAI